MEQRFVVVSDPDGKYPDGEVVDRAKSIDVRDRGGATLSCTPEFFRFAAGSGYSKRSWGQGWALENPAPELVCPLVMFAAPGGPRDLAWAARLVPSPSALDNLRANRPAAQGILRIAAGEQRGGMLRGIVTDDSGCKNAVQVGTLGAPDPRGGWTVYGTARLHLQGEGCCALAFYGFAPGMRIQWVAATLTNS